MRLKLVEIRKVIATDYLLQIRRETCDYISTDREMNGPWKLKMPLKWCFNCFHCWLGRDGELRHCELTSHKIYESSFQPSRTGPTLNKQRRLIFRTLKSGEKNDGNASSQLDEQTISLITRRFLLTDVLSIVSHLDKTDSMSDIANCIIITI